MVGGGDKREEFNHTCVPLPISKTRMGLAGAASRGRHRLGARSRAKTEETFIHSAPRHDVCVVKQPRNTDGRTNAVFSLVKEANEITHRVALHLFMKLHHVDNKRQAKWILTT